MGTDIPCAKTMEAPVDRVLIVDEDESARRQLSQALCAEGIDAFAVHSPDEARAVFARGEPVDLVVAHVEGPGAPGEELVLHLARELPRLALVIVTGSPCFETAQLALRSRANDYMEKPFEDTNAVVMRIRRILVERWTEIENGRLLKELSERNRKLQGEKDLLSRKVDAAQRNLREQLRSVQKSREVFFTDLSRVMAIIDNLVDGIIFTTLDGKVILINPTTGQMLGIPAFTALGRTLDEVEGTRPLLDVLAAHRAQELPPEGIRADVSASREDGAEAHYSVQTNQIHDVNGKLSGVLSLIRDVSLRKKTEHLQNQFLSIVAHELRTPLTAIKAFATILDKGIHGELP
ncbi:MAG: PAS domain S-box protein, partial [Planctomycetota bacterium]